MYVAGQIIQLKFSSYQQMIEFSELSVRANKKNIPQWIYNAGEEILSIQVIRVSNPKTKIESTLLII